MVPSHQLAPERIIVGLDFGTTYSGLAWASNCSPERHETFTTWPASEASDKVPTKLRYAAGETQWGFGVPIDAPPGEVVEWFKLDLDPSLLPLKQVVSNTTADRSVNTLVADYVSALLTHLATTLTQKLGREIPPSALDLVVAVPAIWSDAAKARTRQICEAASGTSVRLVSEPEAAATYAVQELAPRGLRVGDTIVVVDAGGGTVDLASYTVSALGPLEIEEAAPKTGALCGAAFLDMRFVKYLRAKLEGAEGFDEGVLSRAVEHFEKEVKRRFTIHAPPSQTYPFPVPGLPDNASVNVIDGTYALPVSVLHAIFEPVVLETTKLISEHVSSLPAPPKAVLLVGGFGASEYLSESLRAALGGVEVLQPSGAWRAVALGAAMMGLAATGAESPGAKAERRYGVELVARYDEGLHSSIRRKRYWCGLDGCYKVYVMHWFAEGPERTPPLEKSFHWTAPVSKGRVRAVTLNVYTRDASGPPPLSRDATVAPLRRVEADLGGVPETEFKRRRGLDGRWYYDLGCRIEAVCGEGARYAVVFNGGQGHSASN